jgi:hypothetical protein
MGCGVKGYPTPYVDSMAQEPAPAVTPTPSVTPEPIPSPIPKRKKRK